MNEIQPMDGRRNAMKQLAGIGTLLAMGQVRADDKPAVGGMLERAIPRSGEQLPVIGLGTYDAFDVGSSQADRAPLREVLEVLVEQGGCLVDSSPMYGRAEAVVGDLQSELRLRPKLFLATKVWTSGRDAGIRQMEESFRLMRTQRMDLMQIHNLVDVRTHTATLEAWKQQERVRYVGVTHYHEGAYDQLETLIRTREYDFVQLNFSLSEREAEERVLPLAQEMGVAVIANRPFAKASLFGRVRGKALPEWAKEFDCESWAQFFLKYIVSNPAITCVIPATSKPAHARDNLRAGYGRMPDEATRRRMVEYMDRL
jgi:diketogulonate reductase-like aldo/keto reductase